MRRTELAVIGALAVAAVLAAIAGRQASPEGSLRDPRRSTEVHGPNGASAFAQALERLGVPVTRWRRPLFGITGSAPRKDGEWLALLDLIHPLTDAETNEVVSHVERGGSVFLVGRNGVERCFGLQVERVRDGEAPLAAQHPSLSLPPVRYVLLRVEERNAARRARAPAPESACAPPDIVVDQPLLITEDGDAAAARLEIAGGGTAIVLADPQYVSNRVLRTSDAGPLVLGWLLAERPVRVLADEYHQGFGIRGSIFAAAWRWLRGTPVGWMLLQLTLVSLLVLATLAVRFGPVKRLAEHRRRSPLEHVDALAAGLRRSESWDTAVELIVGGLRRRLSVASLYRRRELGSGGSDSSEWLRSLYVATKAPEAHRAIELLERLLQERGGDERVLSTAHAVEDVWRALRRIGV